MMVFLLYTVAVLFSLFVGGALLGALFFAIHNRPRDFELARAKNNPILKPTENPWENRAVFNPAALRIGDTTHLLYRAIGSEGISRFGYASSTDGTLFSHRLPDPAFTVTDLRKNTPHTPLYAPMIYASGGSWGGCEDPRLVSIDGRIYLTFYTFDEDDMIRVSVASIAEADFIAERFDRWSPITFLSPPHEIHKNWVLFPEKINGKFALIHSVDPTVDIAYADSLEEIGTTKPFIKSWYGSRKDLPPREGVWDTHVLGAGPPPIRTSAGWLLFYHAHDSQEPSRYKWGALLLDLADPTREIARSKGPVFEPDAPYENDWKQGVAYACGATVQGETLFVYYGSGEMTVSAASVSLEKFVAALLRGETPRVKKVPPLFTWSFQIPNILTPRPLLTRSPHNPILSPLDGGFESRAVLNPAAIDLDGSVHLLYRAMDATHISTIGYARSEDGVTVVERLSEPVYTPRKSFETKHSHINSGCEDPRVSLIEDRLYMTYVAAGETAEARGALTSISKEDFLARRFDRWTPSTLITIDGMDDKDVALLPEKIGSDFLLYHRIGDRVCAAQLPDLSFKTRVSNCIEVLAPRKGEWDNVKVGIAGPPIKVASGWLLIYHGIDERAVYRLGAALLDPSGLVVLARLREPLLSPDMTYERHGERDTVVFSSGHVVRGDTLFVYYGAGDKVIGVATGSLSKILHALT